MENNKKFGRIIKIGLVLLLVIVPVAVVFGLDGGDTCADAVPITSLPFNDTGDTTSNTNTLSSYSGTCTLPFSYAGEDQIYEITVGPGNLMNFSMDLTGSLGDLALFIISNCGDGTSCVINSQDAIGPGAGPEIISNVTLPPGTHYLYIDSYYDADTPGSAGTFSLSITGTLGDVSQPGVAISKSPASQDVTTNGNADFTITVTNTGDVDLANVNVSDPLVPACDNAIGGLTISQTVSYACQDVGVTGSYTNVVTVTSDLAAGGTGPSASASAVVNFMRPTSVSLTGFGEGGSSATPIWLGALVLLVVGLGLVMRRKLTD